MFLLDLRMFVRLSPRVHDRNVTTATRVLCYCSTAERRAESRRATHTLFPSVDRPLFPQRLEHLNFTNNVRSLTAQYSYTNVLAELTLRILLKLSIVKNM